MAALFSPFTLRGVTFKNRIAVSPMSQYRAQAGVANDWQMVHLGRFALGGAGLVYAEATAVEEIGRRTHGDLGIWKMLLHPFRLFLFTAKQDDPASRPTGILQVIRRPVDAVTHRQDLPPDQIIRRFGG